MKLALILKSINEGDATRFIMNMTGQHFVGLGRDVLLLFYAVQEDEILKKLHEGISKESKIVLYALNGSLHGPGGAGSAVEVLTAILNAPAESAVAPSQSSGEGK